MQDSAKVGKAQQYGANDAARLLAILAAVTTHLIACVRPQFHGKSHDFGYLGIWAVPTFFCPKWLSLSDPFLRAAVNGTGGPDPVLFLQRRCPRILPLHWFAVLFSVVTLCVMGNAPSFTDVAAHLAMLQDFSGQIVQISYPPLWTMPVDFEFYLALPICASAAALFVRRFPAAHRTSITVVILALGFALSCCYRALVLHFSTLTPKGFFVILDNGIGRDWRSS